MLVYSKRKFISWRRLSHRSLLFGFSLFVITGDLLAANVNIAWVASTSPNVGGYIVYYGQSSRYDTAYAASFDVGNSTSYLVPSLQAGTTYYFAVSAYDLTKAFNSGYSNEASITVPVEGTETVQFTQDECLFNWAEDNYPTLFAQAASPTMDSGAYTYRYYSVNNAYIAVSSIDNHVYHKGPNDGNLQDDGPLSYWLPLASCQ